jgi:hypothetical protein
VHRLFAANCNVGNDGRVVGECDGAPHEGTKFFEDVSPPGKVQVHEACFLVLKHHLIRERGEKGGEKVGNVSLDCCGAYWLHAPGNSPSAEYLEIDTPTTSLFLS